MLLDFTNPCLSVDGLCYFDITQALPLAPGLQRLLKPLGVDCGVKLGASVTIRRCLDDGGNCVTEDAKICLFLGVECMFGQGPPPRR